MTEEPHDVSEVLAEALALAKAEEVRARQAVERAQRAISVWSRLEDYQAKAWPAHIASVFYTEGAFFQTLKATHDPRLSQLEALQKASEEEARANLKRFPSDLDRECKTAGIELDRTSRHPRYTIKNFIEIEVDESKLNTQITPRDGNIINVPTDVGAIVSHLATEYRRLFQRDFDAEKLLKSLFTAYQAAVREDSTQMGEDLPIRRVIHRLGKNLSRFNVDEFNIDLARAIKENKNSFDNYRLHLGHTRNTRQGMLLHELEGSGYVGFISFRKN
jgi:hypothetical protein